MVLVKVKPNAQNDGIHRRQARLSVANRTAILCKFFIPANLFIPGIHDKINPPKDAVR